MFGLGAGRNQVRLVPDTVGGSVSRKRVPPVGAGWGFRGRFPRAAEAHATIPAITTKTPSKQRTMTISAVVLPARAIRGANAPNSQQTAMPSSLVASASMDAVRIAFGYP